MAPLLPSICTSVKEQENFITWAFFLPSSPLLTHSGETKLRQQASGETITGPLLFQSWGHPSAQRSRNKGQGFIAGSTVWKETHYNIVWFSEIVDRHPCCFLWMVYSHIITIKQVGLHLNRRMEVCFFVHIYCWIFVQTALCPRVPQPRCRAWQFARVGMSSPLSLTCWRASEAGRGKNAVGEGQPKSKSYRSRCHTAFFVLYPQQEPGFWALLSVYL